MACHGLIYLRLVVAVSLPFHFRKPYSAFGVHSTNQHRLDTVFTDYHSKYYAHALTRRRSSDDPDKLTASLMGATVDLNPHQIDAAMFAFRSPLSRGAILADEVGLGKTIEAGLVISQLWAERKRRTLIIVPTTLRKQWQQELAEKFFLDAEVFDSARLRAGAKSNESNPFLTAKGIVICSYHFARSAEALIAGTHWDLVVIDEAHRLRNVLKSGNKIAVAIKAAIQNAHGKILLTATPLQNSLLELYALTSFLDEHLFGDIESFKQQYLRGALGQREFDELRQRIRPICQRTLRRQVAEYVRYTNRVPMVHDFTPSAAEQRLYEEVSDYLRRDQLFALPKSQRALMILVLRKLLASSSFAIAATLESLRSRVQSLRDGLDTAEADEEAVDFEAFDEVAEEWSDDGSESIAPASPVSVDAVEAEIRDLVRFRDLAASITENSKGQALLQALSAGFEKLRELQANEKAIIFTESRRTQQYLIDLLNANGYNGRVMTFNGTNTDSESASIYRVWKERHDGEQVVSGRKDVDMRAALIEDFQTRAAIMVATEAAAEGVNLQFCSLVVNYDLPWNPQRIEQRIGRCHRYGQRHDVVVINFLNRGNEADQRVFELLRDKFRLFDGVFGSSDEVLGALESGVDFERRIAQIYQSCRTPAEIDTAFNRLQDEMSSEIANRMTTTRATLLENFDEEVHQRLRVTQEKTGERLGRLERWLWLLTKHELGTQARYDDDRHRFFVHNRVPGCPEAPTGTYRLHMRGEVEDGQRPYRLGDPLAEVLITRAKKRELPIAHVRFDYAQAPARISMVEQLRERSGWMAADIVRLDAAQQQEDYLLLSGFSSEESIDAEALEKMFDVPGEVIAPTLVPQDTEERIEELSTRARERLLSVIADRNSRFFEEEIEKLDRWGEDRKKSLEFELKALRGEISALKKQSRLEATLDQKVALQRKAKDMESQLGRKRREMYEAEDEIDRQKETLISTVEAKLKQEVRSERLFMIRWEVQ
jgi:ERCC4-related helicase